MTASEIALRALPGEAGLCRAAERARDDDGAPGRGARRARVAGHPAADGPADTRTATGRRPEATAPPVTTSFLASPEPFSGRRVKNRPENRIYEVEGKP